MPKHYYREMTTEYGKFCGACSESPETNPECDGKVPNPVWHSEGPMCSYDACLCWDKYCSITGAKRKQCDQPEACGAIAIHLRQEVDDLLSQVSAMSKTMLNMLLEDKNKAIHLLTKDDPKA